MLSKSNHWFLGRIQTIHFIGIGGIGMSGLAEILLNLGFRVQGSDEKETPILNRLRAQGAVTYIGHRETQIRNADAVVYSSAISDSNPERIAAEKLHIPTIRRAELLAELMRLKYGIAIAGAHGKTTTTSLIAHILVQAGLDPTVVVGGNAKNIGTNSRIGNGMFFVAEADESDESFLCLTPIIAVVTNVDEEHLDHYLNLSHIIDSFSNFLSRVPFFGAAVVCGDDINVRAVMQKFSRRAVLYGFNRDNDIIAHNLSNLGNSQTFDVIAGDNNLGRFEIKQPGKHMVLNALASIGVSLELGVDPLIMKRSMLDFTGVKRRLEFKGEKKGIVVLDDYAHHPTEIKATLDAIRQFFKGKLWIVFQPHRYSRTFFLMNKFADVLKDADALILLPIYAASEMPIDGVTSGHLKEAILKEQNKEVYLCRDHQHAVAVLQENAKPGDLIATLGAGSVYQVGEIYLQIS